MDIRQPFRKTEIPKEVTDVLRQREELKARQEQDHVVNNMYSIMGEADKTQRLRGGRE